MTLLDEMNVTVFPTDLTRKLTIDGKTDIHSVYRVKLDRLYYNDMNDRIATWINKYESENGKLDHEDRQTYNNIIQEFIMDSNPDAMAATLKNIEIAGQREAGVVLPDGRIIDGNRRYTCLRKLAEQGKKNFEFFETVILDGNYSPSDKRIKTLELNIQLGTEKPVDYDPIDRMYAVYRDVVKNKMFTVKEYSIETNMPEVKVKELIAKATLMVEFLDFIEAPEQYYLAREMKLDGPLQEAVGALKKCKDDDQRHRMKTAIFSNLAAQPTPDMTRHIRKFKKIASSPDVEEFLDKQEEIAVEILEVLSESQDSVRDGIKAVRADEKVKTALSRSTSSAAEKADRDTARDIPIKNTSDAIRLLEGIDQQMVTLMSEDRKKALLGLLDDLEESMRVIRGLI